MRLNLAILFQAQKILGEKRSWTDIGAGVVVMAGLGMAVGGTGGGSTKTWTVEELLDTYAFFPFLFSSPVNLVPGQLSFCAFVVWIVTRTRLTARRLLSLIVRTSRYSTTGSIVMLTILGIVTFGAYLILRLHHQRYPAPQPPSVAEKETAIREGRELEYTRPQ